PGAAGGGAIALRSNGRITIAGTVAADGGSGVDRGGAGAGGSILISADHLVIGPWARITANGGDDYDAAGGGGGRIAISATTRLTFESGSLQARGGRVTNGPESRAALDGGAGTIYLERPGQQQAGELRISAEDDRAAATLHLTRPTPLSTSSAFGQCTVGPRALVRLDAPVTCPAGAMSVDGTAVVVQPDDRPTLTITPTLPPGASLPRASSIQSGFAASSVAGVASVTFLWPAGENRVEPIALHPVTFSSTQPVLLPVRADAAVGSTTLAARVVDRAGRSFETAPMPYAIIENATPVIGELTVAPESLYPGRNVTAIVSASDDIAITKITAKATIGTTVTTLVREPKTQSVIGETFVFPVPQSTPGTTPMNVEVAVEDGFPARDAIRQAKPVTIQKDVVAPLLLVAEPVADQLFEERTGAMISVRATASDAEVAVKEVMVRVGQASPVMMTFSNDEWRASVAVPTVEGGEIVPVSLVVSASDFEGNAATKTVTIRVKPLIDPNGPKLSWTCASDGALYPAGQAARLRVHAIGATTGNGVQKVEFQTGADEVLVAQPVSGLSDQYEASYPVPDVGEGTILTVRAIATSIAGNKTTIDTRLEVIRPDAPVITADLTIDAANAATYENKTVVVRGGTVTVVGARTFDRLVVLGGIVTHRAGGGERLDLSVTRTTFIACEGMIDTTGRGYVAATYPGAVLPTVNSAGGHMGLGGIWAPPGGSAFGSVERPSESGGGAPANFAGGGIVRLRTATLRSEGVIRANGGSRGGGGSIWITTVALDGPLGTIEANGGGGSSVSTGGGGAIAIEFTTGTDRRGTVRATGGGLLNPVTRSGGAGTVFFKGPDSVFGTLTIDNVSYAGQPTILPPLGAGVAQPGTDGAVLVTDRSETVAAYFIGHWVEVSRANGDPKGTWRIASIDETNHRMVRLAADDGETIALIPGDRWQGVYRFDALYAPSGDAITSPDPLRLGSNGTFTLSGPTAAGKVLELAQPVAGRDVTVTGNVAVPSIRAESLTIAKDAVLTPLRTNPASIDLDVSGTLAIESGAMLDATGRGYAGSSYPGAVVAAVNSAGSHLGVGGLWSAPAGSTFGSVERPSEAGGGAMGSYVGGGVIRIRATTLRNDGTIRANGTARGAGGSIWITSGTLDGANGTIEANGGGGSSLTSGGGGAIKVEYGLPASSLGSVRATGGAELAKAAQSGGAGTVLVKGPGAVFGALTVSNGYKGQPTELPGFGQGVAQTGTQGATLVTDRAAETPPYFVGHWLEVSTPGGSAKGKWRIAAIDAINKRTVTLAPNQSETIELAAGDTWRGLYRFDAVSVHNAVLSTGEDRLESTTPIETTSAPSAQPLTSDQPQRMDCSQDRLRSVQAATARVVGGEPVRVNLVLDCPAPAGGATVQILVSDSLVATAPSTVVIPAGHLTSSFAVVTRPTAIGREVVVTGIYGGTTSAAFALLPVERER
ncbi:MAG: hypothetical protein WA208_13670, partial [Thermoanaerobaculia bacterium]